MWRIVSAYDLRPERAIEQRKIRWNFAHRGRAILNDNLQRQIEAACRVIV
jgi:hypothetical protein